MEIDKVIMEKRRKIEESTGNEVRLIEDNTIRHHASINFPSWIGDMRRELPSILYHKDHKSISILHELLHIEKFFVDKHSIVTFTYDTEHQYDYLVPTIAVYKGIPEDYVVHKILSEEGYSPIDFINTLWFHKSRSIKRAILILAANLINYFSFSRYCPEYQEKYDEFYNEVMKKRNEAFLIAEKGINLLTKTNVHNKVSVDECVDGFINIFSPRQYEDDTIYASHFEKIKDVWTYQRTFPKKGH